MPIKKLSICLLLVLLASATTVSASDDEFSFKVTNSTDQTIKKILVSEDGKEWGYFNIGAGIKAGKTITLVWDKSTNGESCEQYFKAVFADGSESEPALFDFCESDVALEFE